MIIVFFSGPMYLVSYAEQLLRISRVHSLFKIIASICAIPVKMSLAIDAIVMAVTVNPTPPPSPDDADVFVSMCISRDMC